MVTTILGIGFIAFVVLLVIAHGGKLLEEWRRNN